MIAGLFCWTPLSGLKFCQAALQILDPRLDVRRCPSIVEIRSVVLLAFQRLQVDERGFYYLGLRQALAVVQLFFGLIQQKIAKNLFD